jgi:hypothetical protein
VTPHTEGSRRVGLPLSHSEARTVHQLRQDAIETVYLSKINGFLQPYIAETLSALEADA